MARSIWKGPVLNSSILKKIHKGVRNQKIWSRSATIIKEFIDYEFLIHTGKDFITLKVTEDMVGHKFGEFASTRSTGKHKKSKKKK
jgi:small subunit ribosomal protein S19